MSKKFVLGCGKVIDSKITTLSNNFDRYPKIPQNKLTELIAKGEPQQLNQYIFSLFEECRTNQLSMDVVCMLYMELVQYCLTYISQRGMEISSVYGEDFFPYTDLKNLSSIDEASNRVVNIYATALDSFDQKYTRSLQIAEEAKEYIFKHYTDNDLSVDNLARKLYINVGYLRSVFKKEVGATVSNYIFEIRMQKAHDLIASENIKLTDISEMVGFNDISYFSRCFKKKYGTSPSEYATYLKKSK